MEREKLANLANYNRNIEKKKQRTLKTSLKAMIEEFGITNGSFKVYVRDGRASERVEIQKQFRQELN